MYLVHLGLSDNMVAAEEVVNEAAVLMVVMLDKVGDFCKECFKPMTYPIRCKKCPLCFYCSMECKQKDPYHEYECKHWAQRTQYAETTTRLIFKAMQKISAGDNELEAIVEQLQPDPTIYTNQMKFMIIKCMKEFLQGIWEAIQEVVPKG